MTIAVVTHESIATHRGWAINEVHRVLDKLDPDCTEDVTVRLDPGLALDVAESLALGERVLTVLPAQAHHVPLFEAYHRHGVGRRLEVLLDVMHGVQTQFLPPTGGGRVDFAERDRYLAAVATTHVAIYDGRDRGSVVRYLQHVLGVQRTIIIDPRAQHTWAAKVHTFEESDVPVPDVELAVG